MNYLNSILLAAGGVLAISIPALAEHSEQVTGIHKELNRVVTKINRGIIFIKTAPTTRTSSQKKADRVELHVARVGDEIILFINDNNVVMDVHKKEGPIHGPILVTGTLD